MVILQAHCRMMLKPLRPSVRPRTVMVCAQEWLDLGVLIRGISGWSGRLLNLRSCGKCRRVATGIKVTWWGQCLVCLSQFYDSGRWLSV